MTYGPKWPTWLTIPAQKGSSHSKHLGNSSEKLNMGKTQTFPFY